MAALGTPTVDPELRRTLLEEYVTHSTSAGLSEWLRDIGQDPSGTVTEKRERVRQHTKYLTMPAEEFPQQTIYYLTLCPTDVLADICNVLGLSEDGSKDQLFRRIYREVGYREGWLRRPRPPVSEPCIGDVLPFVEWYPVLKARQYERDYYREFYEEMEEVFGEEAVHDQLPVAHGSTLKIDFHIGHPQRGGVGVEFKMPTSSSEMQRALGQMDQYAARYGENLIVVLFSAFLDKAKTTLFVEELNRKRIQVVLKAKGC